MSFLRTLDPSVTHPPPWKHEPSPVLKCWGSVPPPRPLSRRYLGPKETYDTEENVKMMGCGVLGCGLWGVRSWVWGLRVWGVGSWTVGCGVWVLGCGCGVLECGVWGGNGGEDRE